MTDTIDITPTREGQINIAHRFVVQVLADVRSKRKDDDTALVEGIVDIAFTLGFNAPRHTLEAALAEKNEVIAGILRR